MATSGDGTGEVESSECRTAVCGRAKRRKASGASCSDEKIPTRTRGKIRRIVAKPTVFVCGSERWAVDGRADQIRFRCRIQKPLNVITTDD